MEHHTRPADAIVWAIRIWDARQRGASQKSHWPVFCRARSSPVSGGQESGLDCAMAYEVDFVNVSTVGLESSPVAAALAGLRANEARYFKNRYGQAFVVEPAKKAKKLVDYVHRILKEERD